MGFSPTKHWISFEATTSQKVCYKNKNAANMEEEKGNVLLSHFVQDFDGSFRWQVTAAASKVTSLHFTTKVKLLIITTNMYFHKDGFLYFM